MMSHINTTLISVKLSKIYPSQMTVGKKEVNLKHEEWHNLTSKKRKELLNNHFPPGIIRPKGLFNITDHHHLVLALIEEGLADVNVVILKEGKRCNYPENGQL